MKTSHNPNPQNLKNSNLEGGGLFPVLVKSATRMWLALGPGENTSYSTVRLRRKRYRSQLATRDAFVYA